MNNSLALNLNRLLLAYSLPISSYNLTLSFYFSILKKAFKSAILSFNLFVSVTLYLDNENIYTA